MSDFEARLQRLEDEAAIARLIASYGPLVDAGSASEVADLWEPDGVYDVDELVMNGRDEIVAMVQSPNHQRWIAGGCAHFIGPPVVTVTGDEALAVCHSLMIVNRDGQFVVRRATANHWRLRRGEDGWQVAVRTNRVLDGRPEAPALFSEAGG
ncbi:nuclear transport factor 2 family protein [Nocardioides sp. B-3]|uniref:nuclear transport factor 2 family protein n=1 Tax=Nocardioides sp. B-3 TaxID=2895565 RepID=UPI0021527E71|nr:nuclear transport factor 2 family protein [Nocardioides sp. B-3]UUZ59450.1 nuclear transport factor 2 family protein [Nocardioides sp. B-3]